MSTEQNYVGRGKTANPSTPTAQKGFKPALIHNNRLRPLAELKFEPGYLDMSLCLFRQQGAPSELEVLITSLRFYKEHLESLTPTEHIAQLVVKLDSLLETITDLAFERLSEQADILSALVQWEGGELK